MLKQATVNFLYSMAHKLHSHWQSEVALVTFLLIWIILTIWFVFWAIWRQQWRIASSGTSILKSFDIAPNAVWPKTCPAVTLIWKCWIIQWQYNDCISMWTIFIWHSVLDTVINISLLMYCSVLYCTDFILQLFETDIGHNNRKCLPTCKTLCTRHLRTFVANVRSSQMAS
jgi:hypothetical protein